MMIRGITVFLLSVSLVSSDYVTYYADEICINIFGKEFANLYLESSSGPRSSVILKATRTTPYSRAKNCTINIIPNSNPRHGVILSIREVDFSYLPTYCTDHMKIYDGSVFSPITLCGYNLDYSEIRSYSRFGNISLLYHTNDKWYPLLTEGGFEVIATAYSSTPCLLRDEFRCANSRCIWSGLTCDGHNNCGDRSDERLDLCETFPNGYSFGNYILIVCFGVLAAIVFLSTLLLICIKARRLRSRSAAALPQFRPPPPYQTVYPSGYSISRNPAGYSPRCVQELQAEGGITNPCLLPDAPPPYKP